MAKRKKEYKGFVYCREEGAIRATLRSVFAMIPESEARAAFYIDDIGNVPGICERVKSIWRVRVTVLACSDGIVGIECLGRSLGTDCNPMSPDLTRHCCKIGASGTHHRMILGDDFELDEYKDEWDCVSDGLAYEMSDIIGTLVSSHYWMISSYHEILNRSRGDLLSVNEIVGLASKTEVA